MRRKITILAMLLMILSLSGCGLVSDKVKEEEKKEEIKLEKYKRKELALENFYVKNNEYYYKALTDFECRLESGIIPDISRAIFLSENEILVPTLYNNDKLIFYTDQVVPETFRFERFEDNGYTVGLFNINKGEEQSRYGFTYSDSNMVLSSDMYEKIKNVEDNTFFLIETFDKQILDDKLLTRGRTIKGLTYGKEYEIEFYKGSQYNKIKVIADIHAFTSVDIDSTTKYNFDKKNSIIEVEMPENLESGYYLINDQYFIRFKKENRVEDKKK